MGWRDQQLPPSFRGIAFDIAGDTLDGGVRGTTHTYPKRDKHLREPMGRKPRGFRVTGTVAGDDYIEQLERLIGALEDGRPGELIHPWFGSLIVDVLDFTVSHASDALGLATVDMVFEESGERAFPSIDASGPDAIDLTADIVDTSAERDAISVTDISGRPAWVTQQASDRVQWLAGVVRATAVWPVRTVLSDALALSTGLDDLEAQSESLAGDVVSQAKAVRALAENIGDLSPLVRTISQLPLPSSSSAATGDAIAADAATEGAARLWRRTLIAACARAATAATWRTYEEAVAARDQLARFIDEELAAVPLDGDVFDALSELRSTASADLTERAAKLPRQRIVEVQGETPAVVLAWRYYRDASRLDELVDRNDIPHPGFVSGSLGVLTS